MSFLKVKHEKITFGIIVGNRDVFPSELAKQRRLEIVEVMEIMGYNYVILSENDNKNGTVETYEDAKKYASLFKTCKEKIGGVIVILPNFGVFLIFCLVLLVIRKLLKK